MQIKDDVFPRLLVASGSRDVARDGHELPSDAVASAPLPGPPPGPPVGAGHLLGGRGRAGVAVSWQRSCVVVIT